LFLAIIITLPLNKRVGSIYLAITTHHLSTASLIAHDGDTQMDLSGDKFDFFAILFGTITRFSLNGVVESNQMMQFLRLMSQLEVDSEGP
jgi:hypothetical protein